LSIGESFARIGNKGGNKMKEVTKETLIGDVIKICPEAKAVIEKHFGNGCFTCPGINVESITFGSAMHNIDPQVIVDEVNEVLKAEV
jgi:hypothetical protein